MAPAVIIVLHMFGLLHVAHSVCSNISQGTCYILCSSQGSCKQTNIICESGHDCSIICDGQNSCKQAKTIQCASGHSCSIACPGQSSCREVPVDANDATDVTCRWRCRRRGRWIGGEHGGSNGRRHLASRLPDQRKFLGQRGDRKNFIHVRL